jgi:membrane fusion protein, multidrug efflux system
MESTNTANPSESLAQKDGHVTSSILIPEKTLTDPGSPTPKQKTPFLNPRKLIFFSLLGIGVITLAIFIYRWWRYAQTHQETENAYISGHVVPVTARISGTVKQVLVDDNQSITQGSLLLKLDPSDLQVSLQQDQEALEIARRQSEVAKINIDVVSTTAKGQRTVAQGNIGAADANIETAQASLAEEQAGVSAKDAILAQTEANLTKAQLDYQRYNHLYKGGAVSRQQLESIKATYQALVAQRNSNREQIRQAQAAVAQAQKKLDSAQANKESSKGNLQQANATGKQTQASRGQYQAALAAIAQAQSKVKNSQLQVGYTIIKSPVAGKIGNKTVEIGQRVQPGQTLLSVVQEQPWIIANFKETQLGKMQPGQKAEIKIDAFPNHTFKGRVKSLSPASGAKFALLPPDNATGNFTKIVQRIPVKIVFELESIRGYEDRITPGMSAAVAVENL